MKDEIKEILEDIKEIYYFKPLLDYITNLQEEIERQSKAQVILDNQITEMYDYKSRNEKAIEYIKQHTEQRIYQEPYNIDGYPDRVEYFIEGKWNLLDILQGDDKDVKG